MRRRSKGILAWIVVFALICSNIGALAATMQLPGSLKTIRDEAFLNAAALDEVIVPEGTVQIGPRAFANSSVTKVVLPRSVRYIADDAFEDCGNLTIYVYSGSFAHEWVSLRDIRYVVIAEEKDPDSVFEVWNVGMSVETDESGTEQVYLGAYVDATEACTLSIAVLNDVTEVYLQGYSISVPAGTDQALLKTAVVQMPEYFILEAVLFDESGMQLCEPCRDYSHTRDYMTFIAMTPEDHVAANEKVLDFGSTGYAVLADDVIPLDVPASDNGNGSYTFATEEDLQPGDTVQIEVDGEDRVIKILSVREKDGTVTVVQDQDVYLEDLYKVVNISSDIVDETSVQTLGRGLSLPVFSKENTIQAGPLELSYQTQVQLHIDFKYHWNFLKEGELKLTLETKGRVEGFVGGAIDTYKDELMPGCGLAPAIQLFNKVVIIPGIHAPGFLNVSIPFHIKAKAGGSFGCDMNNTYGFTFRGGKFSSSKQEGDKNAEVRATGDIELFFGLEGSLNVALFSVLNSKVGLQVGLKGVGKVNTPPVYGATTAESVHACDICLDAELFGVANVRASVIYKISRKINGSLVDAKIALGEIKLGELYFSAVNERESMFGGIPAFGWNEDCPNYKHRVRVYAVESDGQQVSGKPVEVTGGKGDPVSGESMLSTYLYDGSYSAEVVFDSNTVSERFTVEEGPEDVVVTNHTLDVSGHVRDSKSGDAISGATVKVTSGGKTYTADTDANGYYAFKDIPGTVFDFAVSAEDYHEAYEVITVTSSACHTTRTLDFKLIPAKLVDISGCITDEETGDPVSGADVQIILEDGAVEETVTDAEGMYEFKALDGEVFRYLISADGYQSRNAEIRVPEPGKCTADFVLTPDPTESNISGCVTDSDTGYKIPQATVRLTLGDGEILTTQTDANGCYTFEAVSGLNFGMTVACYQYLNEECNIALTEPSRNCIQDFKLIPNIPDPNGKPYAARQVRENTGVISASGSLVSGGLIYEMGYTGSASTGDLGEAIFNLKGKYNTLSFRTGYYKGEERDATMTVTADGTVIIDKKPIKHNGSLRTVSIPVSGVHKLSIRFDSAGYDKAWYVMSDISLSPGVQTEEAAIVSLESFNDHCISGFQASMTKGYFQMGGYTYQGGYTIYGGYNWCKYDGYVVLDFKGEYSRMTFDIGKLMDKIPENQLESATLTITADGVAVAGYDGMELKWDALPHYVSLNLSGVSQLKININYPGYIRRTWGIGNIQLSK